MGSSASKSCEPDPPPQLPAAGHRRSYSRNVFQSSCIQPASGSPDGSDIDDEDDEEQAGVGDRRAEENGITGGCSCNRNRSTSRPKGTRKPKAQRASKTCEPRGASNLARTVSGHGGGSGRFLSRLGLFNGSLSPRLSARSDSSSDRDPREPARNGPRGDPNVSGHDERRDVEAHEPTEPNIFSEACETGSHGSISTTSSGYSQSGPFQAQNTRARRARYIDLLEHRSNFIERRRRLRSQVCALHRMGSHFQGPSGQHRQDQTDGAHARASISRIVVLAEALFEVLDEIHQQSVVLSTRSPLSSIGSVPAPNEAVEALPVKRHRKSPKQEDAQCYICLVDYEEGDEVRVLPCRHEFHKSCVDKWLVDIRRICPLCRGDVCKTDSTPAAAS